VAPSVGKLKIAWNINSTLPSVFVCNDQTVTEKIYLLFPK
jgi:hypothetical protein